MMYEINYIINTDKEMEEWLSDFQSWLEIRNERICGTIKPLKEEVK